MCSACENGIKLRLWRVIEMARSHSGSFSDSIVRHTHTHTYQLPPAHTHTGLAFQRRWRRCAPSSAHALTFTDAPKLTASLRECRRRAAVSLPSPLPVSLCLPGPVAPLLPYPKGVSQCDEAETLQALFGIKMHEKCLMHSNNICSHIRSGPAVLRPCV